MSEREELERAIAALEAQRISLGDAVVDASISALREKLATLDASQTTNRQRKQATILYMDVVGSTAMIRELDPEDNLAIMDIALRQFSHPVVDFNGRVTRFMGDGFMALFGHPVASEHDPDNAIRAGLAIIEEAQNYSQEVKSRWGIGEFKVRIGIDTGLIVIGGDTEAENTIAGAAVNLAARLERAAQPGSVLISHNTYQHVRGVFDLLPLPPLQAKGFAEPVPVYQVLKAKARSFRTRRRGVAGIETRIIGRESEHKVLQDAFDAVLSGGQEQMVTIVGEAGLGKSRLLYEFENWVDLQPALFTLLRGRARQETQAQPYGLLRDLFAFRFGLQDTDSTEVVRQKFAAGFMQVPGAAAHDTGEAPEQVEMKAHFVGHLLGFDFNASQFIQPLSGDPQQLRDRALIYLSEYLRSAAAHDPLLILLEDLHWADDSSLDALNRLTMTLRESAILIVTAARPTLYERRPHWLGDHGFHLRLDLRPLSTVESHLLTQEVLQKVGSVPDDLRDLIVVNAEGNPFFLEELINMLIEEGVIVKEEPAWRVILQKLAGVHVPSTLTGVLQARLDSLSTGERVTLQRASVIGRMFWEQAVAYLQSKSDTAMTDLDVAVGLVSLRNKEMIFNHEMSTFADMQEFIFKHALLRDVTYESVLKKARQNYHGLTADWLIRQSGERVNEMSGMIADHLKLAGNNNEALVYMRHAGEEAGARFAHEEAADYFSRALELVEESDLENRFELLLAQEAAYDQLGSRDLQHKVLQALEEVVSGMGDDSRQANVDYLRSNFLLNTNDYVGAIQAAHLATDLAREVGDDKIGSLAYKIWGHALQLQGRYQESKAPSEAALALAQKAQDLTAEGLAFNNLGLLYYQMGSLDPARYHFEQAARLARQAGNNRLECIALNNLGNIAADQREYDMALAYYQQSYQISRSIGDRRSETIVLGNSGWIDALLGRYADARKFLIEALAIDREIGDRQMEGYSILNLALVAVNSAEFEAAISHAQQGLGIARAIGDRSGEAFALTYLGHAYLGLGDAAEAMAAYNKAVAINRELEQDHLVTEPLAGLARVSMTEGDQPAALLSVEAILNYLDNGGSLDGTEQPMLVILTCYKVLNAAQDPRAIEILSTSYTLLQEWAAKLTDEAVRRSFLENVPWHREIMQAAQFHHL